MAKKPGQVTIYFCKDQMDYFEQNQTHIQKFTRYAVDNRIEEEEMKRKGFVKKFVKED